MNLYVILGVALALFVSAGTGAYYGYEYRDGKVAKEISDAEASAIRVANAQADRDKKLAVAQAAKETQARTTAMMIRNRANVAISAKPQPTVCDWNPDAYSVLLASVSAANGDADGAASLSNAVSTANGPGK